MKKEELISILIVILLLPIATANTAPSLSEIDDELFVCENSAMNLEFSARDIDEQELTIDISPKDTFFVRKTFATADSAQAELFSGILTKNHTLQPYDSTISVSDGELVDSKDVEITVIEVNNPPTIQNNTVLDTVSLYHDKIYWKKMKVTDKEDGNEISEDITFTLEFLEGPKIFDITQRGEIYFVAEQTEIGFYKMRVCAQDSGLKAPHKRIDLCENAAEKKSVCQELQLAITSKNTEPTITSHSPANLIANATKEIPTINFSMKSFDPEGLTLQTSWYVGTNLTKTEIAETSKFQHTFGCGIPRKEKIKAEISDGLLSDSIEWQIDIKGFPCVEENTSESQGDLCQTKMACSDWDLCQNAFRSLEIGAVSREDYDNIKTGCDEQTWNEEFCGFQIRSCFDVNNCESEDEKPAEIQLCYFSLEPSCTDGLINCHTSACEIATDCGGSCPPCETCSDEIRNQNEEGTDCGGECKLTCPTGFQILKSKMKYPLFIAIALFIGLIIFQSVRIKRIKKDLGIEPKKQMGPEKPEELKKEENKDEKK